MALGTAASVHISGVIVVTLLSIRRDSWAKDDVRAAIELGAAGAGAGALAGWFSGYGVLIGSAVAIALLALVLGLGCLVEAVWSRNRGS